MKITGLFDSHNSPTASPYIFPSDCGQLFNVCSMLLYHTEQNYIVNSISQCFSCPGIRCTDRDERCPGWASKGRCKTDQWVYRNCLFSCDRTDICDSEQPRPSGTISCCIKLHVMWDFCEGEIALMLLLQ